MVTEKKANNNWVIWLSVFVFFCIAVYTLRSVLLPFVAGIVIGYLLDPWADKFEKIGINRTIATILVMLLVVIILIPALIMLFSIIDNQLEHFNKAVPNYLNSLSVKLEPLFAELQDNFPG